MRSWPALEVSVVRATETDVGAGFSRLDDRLDILQGSLLDFNIAAIDETSGTWRVFFNSAADRDAALAALPSQFSDLIFTAVDVADEDWAARSQASLRAIQVGNVIVAPPWDIPTSRLKPAPTTEGDVGAGFSRLVTIVIQPSMGFGTGHHATTRLCLAALQQIDLRDRTVLDVGTGSGVLAIAASLLGAARVVAIDDDPDAIQAAHENVELNAGAQVELQAVDLRAAALSAFDVVTANLTGGLLVQAASRLQEVCAPSGRLILSGFMAHEEADVLGAYASLHLGPRAQEDEWMCVTWQREG